MGKKSSKAGAERSGGGSAAEELTYEQAMDRLEEIVEQIESGELGLEESMRAYEEGQGLIARCRAVLAQAEQRIVELDAKRAGGGSGGGGGV
jgi:exodeoxyribonuclease VII small subunit